MRMSANGRHQPPVPERVAGQKTSMPGPIARGFGLRGTNITSLDQFGSLLRDYEASGEAEVWNIPISDRVPSLYTLRAAQAKH